MKTKNRIDQSFPRQGKYTCPMHPEVVSDSAGHCHKCGMKLVPMGQQMKTITSL